MNIRHLKTLVTVAETDSFSAAAERLYITPAAVSLQMKTLETELGVVIFDRSKRSPRLNARGEALIDKARGVLGSYDQFVEVAGRTLKVRGRLLLGSVSGISSDLLPRALANLSWQHPGLRIRIVEGISSPLVRRVLRGELDAAIVTGQVADNPSLTSLPILREPLMLVAPRDASGAGLKDILRRRPFLRINRHSGVGALIEQYLREQGLRTRDAMELDSTEAVIHMAASGLGAGVVPAGRISSDDAKKVHVVPFGDPPVSREVVLVERRNKRDSGPAQALYAELQRLVAPTSDLKSGFPPSPGRHLG